MRVGLRPALGAELDVAVGHRVGGLLDAGVLEEPLHRDARLDRHMRALGKADIVFVLLDLEQKPHFLEHGRGFFARQKAVEPVKLRALRTLDATIGREHIDDLESVALADFKVRLVVRRRDLESARAELDVDMLIGNDRNFRLRERPQHLAPDVLGKARILRVHRDRDIAHQRFGTRGGNFQILARRIGERVFHEVKFRALRGHDDLLVGQRRQRNRAPVDHPLAAINETFLEELDEDMAHPLRVGLVHREALAAPIAGTAEALELLDDDVAVFVFEIPDTLEKFFAAEVAAAEPFAFAQLALDLRLRRNAGMVGARQPKNFLALLARPPCKDILQRVVEHMAEVQNPGDIRRRDDNRVRILGRSRIGFETFPIEPSGIPPGFDRTRFIGFRQFRHRRGCLPDPAGFVQCRSCLFQMHQRRRSLVLPAASGEM